MESIGKKIRRIRIEKGMSQDDLANAVGISKAGISRYELGQREPRYSRLQAIANALGVPVVTLTNFFPEQSVAQEPQEANIRNIKRSGRVTVGQEEKKQSEKINKLLFYFGQLSDKAQQDAIRRIVEMTKIHEYRRLQNITPVGKVMLQYITQKEKIDYVIIEDRMEEVCIIEDGPFGGCERNTKVQHITMVPVDLDKDCQYHFWYYHDEALGSPNEELLRGVVDKHSPDISQPEVYVVFSNPAYYTLAHEQFHRQYMNDGEEDIDIPPLCFLFIGTAGEDKWEVKEECCE